MDESSMKPSERNSLGERRRAREGRTGDDTSGTSRNGFPLVSGIRPDSVIARAIHFRPAIDRMLTGFRASMEEIIRSVEPSGS
jgi:hypothetical protein